MHNVFGSMLSDALMSQATYYDGLLYLPAYDLARELLALSLPLALLCVTTVLLFGTLLVMLVHFLYRRIRKRRT